MKKQWKPWLYIAAALCMSVSCRKEVPDPCNDGSCCGAYDQKLEYQMSFENARADVGFGGLIIENVKGESLICFQQEGIYENQLQQSYDFRTGQPQPFKYRVWGKIFNCNNCPTNRSGAIFTYVQIDKIETVN